MLRKVATLLLVMAIALGAKAESVAVKTAAGTVTYGSLMEAVEAVNASTDAVMTLLSDVNLGSDAATILQSSTLDLNGFTIRGCGHYMFVINKKGMVLTVKDSQGGGTILHEPFESSQTMLVSNGTLLLQGGTIATDYAIQGSSVIYITSAGSLMMEGGHVKMISDASSCNGILNIGGTALLSGGTVENDCYIHGSALYATSTATTTITGGRYISSTTQGLNTDITSNDILHANVSITGGSFANELCLQLYCKDNMVALLPKDSEDYAMGCRYQIVHATPSEDVARNITRQQGYTTLEAALSAAERGDTVTLLKDYVLTQDVTVKEGVMLLVPSDLKNTCFAAQPQGGYHHIEEYRYRTLTVSEGVTVYIKGEMEVNAILTSARGGQWVGTGVPHGAYAMVSLQSQARLVVEGQLYCWGYVAGKGMVDVKPGATLYEAFTFTDWRGGKFTLATSSDIFFFTQYYVQNVESQVRFSYGARNMTCTNLYFEESRHEMYDMPFVTPEAQGLFHMKEGSVITRTYDGATDRVTYDISGDVELGTIELIYDDIHLDSEDYVCPLPNNMTITVSQGMLTLPHCYSMQPGMQITLQEKGGMTVEEDALLYVCDRADWGTYAAAGYVLPLEHTVANGHGNRAVRWGSVSRGNDAASYAKLESARLNIDGTLRVKGDLRTSLHRAEVLGTHGRVLFDNVMREENDTLWQCLNNSDVLEPVPTTPAVLTDSDGTFVPTADGSCFICCDGKWLSGVLGDANGDGMLTIADANMIMNYFLGTGGQGINKPFADVNGDGAITIADANEIVNMYLVK